MAEEHRCQASEGHRLCANNCGFIGSPATMNLCSKCYRDIRLKEQEEASTKSTIETALSSSATFSPTPSTTSSLPSPAVVSIPRLSSKGLTVITESGSASGLISEAVQPNRCAACRKRVRLSGFKCKCGVTFCGAHRYPEKHACRFDYKRVGREEIARANPVIKGSKLERI